MVGMSYDDDDDFDYDEYLDKEFNNASTSHLPKWMVWVCLIMLVLLVFYFVL